MGFNSGFKGLTI